MARKTNAVKLAELILSTRDEQEEYRQELLDIQTDGPHASQRDALLAKTLLKEVNRLAAVEAGIWQAAEALGINTQLSEALFDLTN